MFSSNFLVFIYIWGYVLQCLQSFVTLVYVYNFKACVYVRSTRSKVFTVGAYSFKLPGPISLGNRCCVSSVMTVVNKKNKTRKKQVNEVSFLIILKEV